MKALKHIALLCIALAIISSCTDEHYTNVYEEDWFVDEFEVSNNHWNPVGGQNPYFEYVFDKIPLEVSYYKGIVTAYIYFDYKTQKEIQTPLPYTEYRYDSANDVYYAVQYSYDVKADGTIAFKVHVSDYYLDGFNPGTQYFRVAIIGPID